MLERKIVRIFLLRLGQSFYFKLTFNGDYSIGVYPILILDLFFKKKKLGITPNEQ